MGNYAAGVMATAARQPSQVNNARGAADIATELGTEGRKKECTERETERGEGKTNKQNR